MTTGMTGRDKPVSRRTGRILDAASVEGAVLLDTGRYVFGEFCRGEGRVSAEC